MFGSIYQILFYAIPIGLIALLVFVCKRYKSAKRQNEAAPGTFTDKEIKKRKTAMIVVTVIVGAILTVVLGFTALLYLAVAFM
jgi:heme/copper-type cytochrome/quinol oxidase subunit 2